MLKGKPQRNTITKYDYSKADWQAFQLDEKLVSVPTIQNKEDIELSIKIFTDSITEAIDLSLGNSG